jgi:hypothetical protein
MSGDSSAEKKPARIRVTNAYPGYAHTKYEGTCDPDVTYKEICDWLNLGLGYRSVYLSDCKWGGIRHDD